MLPLQTVSILMPVYLGARYVSRAISSALVQTHGDFELVVVNDGSPDDSAEVIRPFLADPRVIYVEQANAGVAAARNTALRHATGDLFALLDQDDLWHPDKLARQVELFSANPRLGLVHCHAIPIDRDGNALPTDPWRPRATASQAFPEIYMGNPIQACAGMFSRAALDAVGAFDSDPALRFADEYDLWLRIASRFEVGYVPETLAYYRLHGENNSADIGPMVRATQAVLAKSERELPDAVASIPLRDRRSRHARLYLDLADSEVAGGQLLHATLHRLRAWGLAPGLALRHWLGPQRLDHWRWRLDRARGIFNDGGSR